MGKDEGLKIVRRTRYRATFWVEREQRKEGTGRRKGVWSSRQAGRTVGLDCKLDVI